LVQISLFNDIDHAQSSPFYIIRRPVKTEWRVSRREGERKREADCGGERQSLSENLKWREMRNDHWKRHLRIPNK
jgi:hypothetical protein